MKKTLPIIAVIIVIVGAVYFFASRGNKSDNSANNTSSDTSQTTPASTDSTADSTADTTDTGDAMTNEGAAITYGNDGFSPSSVTIKAGQTLTVKNTSSDTVRFESDPHPSHTDNPELNIGDIAPGKSGTAKVSNKGTWGYHNHLNPSETGTIVIN